MDGLTVASWQHRLVGATDTLGRWFEGRVRTAAGPGDLVVPAERFLTDDSLLLETIRRQVPPELPPLPAGHQDRRADLRILASRFARLYSNATTGAALVALANGVGLDLSPARCYLVLRGSSAAGVLLTLDPGLIVRCAARATHWDVRGPVLGTVDELRTQVWSRYYGQHLAPLFTRVAALTGASPKLLWSNAAEMAGLIGDSAEAYLDPAAAAPYVADSRALLDAAELPGLRGPNPLRNKLDWTVHDDGRPPHSVQLRRMCCLIFYLGDRYGRLCENCPHLPVDERVALIRERHGLSQSDPRGPAEQQAVVRGLAWLDRHASGDRT